MTLYSSSGLALDITCVDGSGFEYKLEEEYEGRLIVGIDVLPGWLQLTIQDDMGKEVEFIPERLVRSVKVRHPGQQVAL